MRWVMVLPVVLAVSGCLNQEFVRRPVPHAVSAWWQNVRELNRPDPPNLAIQRFKKGPDHGRIRYSTWQ